MKKVVRFGKVIVLDSLGVLFMIAALLTGWLPGPGGVPLFLVGLSLLAINHDWAKRYIDLLKDYADRIGDVVFIKNPVAQALYDVVAPILIITSVLLLVRHSALWMISLGIFCVFLGLTIFLGNRDRWKKLKRIKQRN